MTSTHRRVLFVCTGNAGRSQMAEALFSAMGIPGVTACSAGVAPWDHLHPMAVRMLQERGIDMAGRHPKPVSTFATVPVDWVVTLGDRALAETPRLSGNPVYVHWDIADPADADGTGREEAAFRNARSMIEARLPDLRGQIESVAVPSALHLEPGLSTCVVRPDRFAPAVHLPAFAAAGFRCIELNCFLGSDDFSWDRPAQVAELRRVAGETGVRVYSIHAEGGIGAYRGGHTERMAVDILKAYADLAAETGASIVTMHAGLPREMDRATAAGQLRRSLDELANHVRGLPCAYAWENEAIGLTLDEHLQWVRDLGPAAFGFVLDTGHSNIHGNTDAYLEKSRGVLCALHLNDNDGKGDYHRMPGAGTVRWRGVADRLQEAGYTGPLMLEIEARDRQKELPAVLAEARASVDLLRRLRV